MLALTMEDAKAWGLLALYLLGGLSTLLGTIFAGLANLKAGRSEKAANAAATTAASAITEIKDHRQAADLKLEAIVEKSDKAIEQNLKIESNVNGNVGKLFEVVNRLVDQVQVYANDNAETRKKLAEVLERSATKEQTIVVTTPPARPPGQRRSTDGPEENAK